MYKKKLNHVQIGIICTLFASLFTLGAAIYRYTGPDRTVATEVSVCVWEKSSCEYVEAKGDYRWHVEDTVYCASESKPWLEGDNYPGECGAFSEGRKQWNKGSETQSGTFTYPSATVDGVPVCDTPGLAGWCRSGGALTINSSEPMDGEKIIAIEGLRNGTNFACAKKATCTLALLEGSNTFSFWAVSSYGDTSLKDSASLKQDSQAPAVNGSLSGTLGNNAWYLSTVDFTGSASDATSGLKSLVCNLDVSNQPDCVNISISGEGAHTLTLTASDNAGNTNQLSKNVSIDSQPPLLNAGLSGTNGNAGWYTSATLNTTSSDPAPGSGIAALEYSVDGGGWAAFNSSYPIPEGKHTLDVRTSDLAGHVTQATQISAWVDSTPPDLTTDVSGTSGVAPWYIAGAQVSASASDAPTGSGLKSLEYSLDGGDWTAYDSALTLADGTHTILFAAEDNAGLVTQVSRTVQVDQAPPQINGSLSGTAGANGWYISNVSLAASVNDPQPTSGMASFTYSLDGTAETDYLNAIALSDGQHILQLNATDNAGLHGSLNQGVQIDTVAPTLTVLSTLPEWAQDTVTLNGTAQDAGSGLARVDVSLDDGASWLPASGTDTWRFAWDTRSGPDGAFLLKVRVTDVAGLTSESSLTAQVDNTAPLISLPASWTIWDTVQLNASDAASGLADVRLEIADPQKRWPKRVFHFSPGSLPVNLKWDRRFGDGTVAPSGDYDVYVLVHDRVGHQTEQTARIAVPWISDPLPDTATPQPPAPPVASPTATLQRPTATASLTATSRANTFGTPQGTAQPTPTATRPPVFRPTATQSSFTDWVQSVFSIPPAASPSTSDFSDNPFPSVPPETTSNVLFGTSALAAVAAVTALAAQKKKEEEEARLAAEAEKRAAEAAAAEDAARRRETARERNMSPEERAAHALKDAIAAVTAKEEKDWKAERYAQISQTDEYKKSGDKSQFMKQDMENIKEQESAYREKKKEDAKAASQLPPPPPPPPPPPMPAGLSPEAQAAWLHSPTAAQWVSSNTAVLQAQYAASVTQVPVNSNLPLSYQLGLARREVGILKGLPNLIAGSALTLNSTRNLLFPAQDPNLTWRGISEMQLNFEAQRPSMAMTEAEYLARFDELGPVRFTTNYTSLANLSEGLGRVTPTALNIASLGMSLTGTYTGNKDLKSTGDTLSSAVGIEQGFQTYGSLNSVVNATSTWYGAALTTAQIPLGVATYGVSLYNLATDPALDPKAGYDAQVKRTGTMLSGVGGALLAGGAVCALIPGGQPVAAILIPAGAIFMGAGGVMQNAEWIGSTAGSLIKNAGSAIQGLLSSPPAPAPVHPAQPNPTPPVTAPVATATPMPQATNPTLVPSTPPAGPVQPPITPSATDTPKP